VSPAVFTETVWAEPFVVPLPGATDSQFPVLEAVAVYETAGPVLVTFSGWVGGLELPTVPVKLKPGEGAGTVVTVVTLNVTVTGRGLLVTPGALEATVTVPVYVPGPGTLVGSAETEIAVTPVVPLAGDTDSQFPVLDAETVNATSELLDVVTDRFCDGEFPFTEFKVIGEGEAIRVNDGGLRVKLTVTASGELVAAL